MIAVLVPYYNPHPMIFRQMLQSVRDQSWSGFRVYLYRDGCDRSKVADEFCTDDRFVHFGSDLNLGEGGARNALIDVAVSDGVEWFTTADPDDLFMRCRMESFANSLESVDDRIAFVSNNSMLGMYVSSDQPVIHASRMDSIRRSQMSGVFKFGRGKNGLYRYKNHAGGTQPLVLWRTRAVYDVRHVTGKSGEDWHWTFRVAKKLRHDGVVGLNYEGLDDTAYVYMCPTPMDQAKRYRGEKNVFFTLRDSDPDVKSMFREERVEVEFDIGATR